MSIENERLFFSLGGGKIMNQTTTLGYEFNRTYFDNVTTSVYPLVNVTAGLAAYVESQLTALVVFMVVTGSTGLIGNILTLYYYRKIDTQRTTNNHLIVLLSTYDLMQCAIVIPLNIIERPITVFMSQPSFNAFCKMSRYFESLVTTCGCSSLAVIAVDRYKRICRPFGNQFSLKEITYISGAAFLVSLVLTLPVFNFYNGWILPNTGMRCFFSWSTFGFYYYAFLLVIIVMENVSLSVAYGRIIYCLFSQNRKRKIMMRASLGTERHAGRGNSDDKSKLKINQIELRITKVMLGITVAFGVSFIPFSLVNILDMSLLLHKITWSSFSLILYTLSFYSYYITAAVNPVIYGYFNMSFRKWLISLFRKSKEHNELTPHNQRNNTSRKTSCIKY